MVKVVRASDLIFNGQLGLVIGFFFNISIFQQVWRHQGSYLVIALSTLIQVLS
jgi:hypothetical protein